MTAKTLDEIFGIKKVDPAAAQRLRRWRNKQKKYSFVSPLCCVGTLSVRIRSVCRMVVNDNPEDFWAQTEADFPNYVKLPSALHRSERLVKDLASQTLIQDTQGPYSNYSLHKSKVSSADTPGADGYYCPLCGAYIREDVNGDETHPNARVIFK